MDDNNLLLQCFPADLKTGAMLLNQNLN